MAEDECKKKPGFSISTNLDAVRRNYFAILRDATQNPVSGTRFQIGRMNQSILNPAQVHLGAIRM